MFLKKALAVSILSMPILAMTGCGGDNATTSENPNTSTTAVPFSLALTDGPVDSATKVVIELTGVTIKQKGAEDIVVEYETSRPIDLLELQDGEVADLISGLELEPGDYDGIHLHINAVKDEVLDSFVEFEDGTILELQLEGKADHGLHITKPFTIVADEPAEFTIDFDLRKSLKFGEEDDFVTLKPHLHLVHNHHAGHLHGDLDSALVAELCADPSIELGAVYVFAGANAVPTDVNGSESDPVASALVKLAPKGEYHYHVGFLEAGEYTVAYTCDAASDNPEEVNELTFAVLEPVTIEERQEHEHPFPPHAPHEEWDESICELITDDVAAEEDAAEGEEAAAEGEEAATEEEATDGEVVTPVRPIPPHIKHWCETGETEWHPAPGKGPKKPLPPVDGEEPVDPVDEAPVEETPEEEAPVEETPVEETPAEEEAV